MAPRTWAVSLSYACRYACHRPWEVADPQLPVEAFTVTRQPGAISIELRCRVAGERRTVIAPAVRDAYAQVMDDLTSGRRAFRWLPARLRRDPSRARELGVGDCAVTSLDLAAELTRAGFEARTRTVTALGLAGVDHCWTEVRDADGECKVLDPVFAHLARKWPQSDPTFGAFSCGSGATASSRGRPPRRTTPCATAARIPTPALSRPSAQERSAMPTDARNLLARVTSPALVADMTSDLELRHAGIGSGDLIRLALLVEDHCGAALSEEDVDGLTTLAAIDALLARLERLADVA